MQREQGGEHGGGGGEGGGDEEGLKRPYGISQSVFLSQEHFFSATTGTSLDLYLSFLHAAMARSTSRNDKAHHGRTTVGS